jgi:cysteine sulfinate desulfinase/cysteine desulfurase-like protein
MGFVIYLDHNATTPILPEVLEAMMPSNEVDS